MHVLLKPCENEWAFVRVLSFGQNNTIGMLNSLDITSKQTDAIPRSAHSIAPPLVTKICIGYLSLLSSAQVRKDKPICLRLHVHEIRPARGLALENTGRMIAATMARKTMPMRSSSTVKARGFVTEPLMVSRACL